MRLNGYIIAIPLLLSFESRVRYVQFWPAVLISIMIVGSLYIIWDAYVTRRGDWRFNKEYLTGRKLFGLPVEEVLFFVTTPFSCIFIYEVLRYIIPFFQIPFAPVFCLLFGVFLLVVAYWFRYQNYTRTVSTITGVTAVLLGLLAGTTIISGHFWMALAVTYLPFVLFNGYLTSAPVVEYNPEAITGVRIGTIPIEDFIYSFAMLSSYFWVFIMAKNWLGV